MSCGGYPLSLDASSVSGNVIGTEWITGKKNMHAQIGKVFTNPASANSMLTVELVTSCLRWGLCL